MEMITYVVVELSPKLSKFKGDFGDVHGLQKLVTGVKWHYVDGGKASHTNINSTLCVGHVL